MNNSVTMEVFESDNNLQYVTLNLKFGKAFPTFKELVERMVRA